MYSESCMPSKWEFIRVCLSYWKKKITACNGDQKKRFKIFNTLIERNKLLSNYDSPLILASVMNTFFIDKLDSIRAESQLLESTILLISFNGFYYAEVHC